MMAGMRERTAPTIPPTWPRVQLADHPPGVKVLSLPVVGTSWVRRGLRYWCGRVLMLALLAMVVAVQCASWWGALGDDYQGGRLSRAGWALAVVGVLGTIEGLRVVLFRQGIPFFQLWTDPNRAVRWCYVLLVAVYLFFVAALTSGMFLSLAVEWLHPTVGHERTARADLDRQLQARGVARPAR